MPISYTQMLHTLEEIAPSLLSKRVLGCHSINDRAFILAFSNAKLLISLRDPFLRFHLTGRIGHEPTTPFQKKLTEHLVGETLLSATLLNEDRILQLQFDHYALIVEFFPRRPNAFLVEKNTITGAMHHVEMTTYTLPPKPTPPQQLENALLSSKELDALYTEREQHALFLAKKNALTQAVAKYRNKAKKRLAVRLDQHGQCQQWNAVQHEGILLQSNLYRIKRGMASITIDDWDNPGEQRIIPLDPTLTPQESIEERFKRSRKLKNGIPHLEELVKKAEKEVGEWEELLQAIQKVSSLEELESFSIAHEKPQQTAPRQKIEVLALPYREFRSAAGLKILVGKTAKDNEELTFRYAHGNDWWLHVSGCAGSHVIIKTDHGKDPDEESLQDALQLAIAYSKVKGRGRIPVTVTQRKFVTHAPRGRAGQVQVSKHKEKNVLQDEQRLKAIKERSKKHCSTLLP